MPVRAVSAVAPYRSASVAPIEERREFPCPYCGNGCPPLVRVCPHCDVRLENVRCAHCFTLQTPGAFACGRCSKSLELEPVLDATDSPCPRCKKPLESSPGEEGRVHECPRCGGIFVRRDALAEILAAAEVSGPMPSPPSPPLFPEVQYFPCPVCRSSMNRMNFGKLSGVIVDVCKQHGTWFDAGELTRVVAFVASGGLARARARTAEEEKDAARRRDGERRELSAFHTRHELEQNVREWGDVLTALLYW